MAEEAPTGSTEDQGEQPAGGAPDAVQAETEKWKQLARKHERESKAAAAKLAALEDAGKSEVERATSRADAAEKRAQETLTRVARAELRALAAADLTNADDAARFLDPGDYLSTAGEFDPAAAAASLTALVAEKPYLAKQSAGPRPPAYQPTQGTTGSGTPTDERSVGAAWLRSQLSR